MSKKLITGIILLAILFTLNPLCYGVRDPFKSYIQEEKSSAAESEKEEETKEEEEGSAESEQQSGRKEDKELTSDDVRTMVPFKLLGIINSGDKRRVLLDTGDNTEIIKNDYSQDDFKLVEIASNSILIKYKEFFIIMKVGGDIVEVRK